MDIQAWIVILSLVILVMNFGLGILLVARFYHKVPHGSVLIRNGAGGPRVSFSGIVSLPYIHTLEVMDVTVKKIPLDLTGDNSPLARNLVPIPLSAEVFLRVGGDPAAILRAAQALGCDRVSRVSTLTELFAGKLSSVIRDIARGFAAEEVIREKARFRKEIMAAIGPDLQGLILDDVSIEFSAERSGR